MNKKNFYGDLFKKLITGLENLQEETTNELHMQKIILDHKDIDQFEELNKKFLDKNQREEFLKGFAEYKQQILAFKELDIPVEITSQIILSEKEIEEIKFLTYIHLKYGDFYKEDEREDLKVLVASLCLHVNERIQVNAPKEMIEFAEEQMNGKMEMHLKQEYYEILKLINKK